MDKNLLMLEFDKILELLSKEASCEESKDRVMLLRPQNNMGFVNNLLQQTYDAHMLMGRFGSPSFYGIKNIKEAVERANFGAVLSTIELLRTATALKAFREIKEWKKHSEGMQTHTDFMFDNITPNKYLEERIFSSILSEDEISDNASSELNSIRRKIRNLNSKIRERLDAMLKSSKLQKYFQDPIITMRNDRLVVPVKMEYRNEISGLVHDTSSSGATVFIEPVGVVEDNNQIKLLQSQEKEEIDKILKDLSFEVGNFYESIISSYNAAIDLDIIFAKASLAYKMRASLPIINKDGKVKLNKARHPLIDKNIVVPIDIELGTSFDTLIITGPNTGGKTVSIKIIGLFCIMAMCGLMIPASDSSMISIFDKILVDIGDEQSIEHSLSTFSSHMKNVISILSNCTSNSLIILDEIGAGTDPIEGAALARAIIENMREKEAKVAVTTHYKELKEYAIKEKGIENASCEFDISIMKPTYKLLMGIPGRSNAFLISERLGMDENIIERAKTFKTDEDNRLEDVIQGLEATRQELEKEKKQFYDLNLKLENDKKELDYKLNNIENQKKDIISKAQEKAKNILDDVRTRSELIFEELDNIKNNYEGLDISKRAGLKSEIRELENIADPVEKSKIKSNVEYIPKVGENVLVLDINKEGVILSEPDNLGKALVQIGAMKIRVAKENLKKLGNDASKPKIKGKVTKNAVSRSSMNVSNEIDVRGQNIIDATLNLDSFIDSALMAGIKQLTIVHGKGTGVLRKGIHEYLKKHKSVKRFRLGVYGEGETGVTILELK